MSENKVTEDGLIEKALRVMGARPGATGLSFTLARIGKPLLVDLSQEDGRALFIHEAKLYLRELGAENFEVWFSFDTEDEAAVSLVVMSVRTRLIDISAPTEHEAYAQAVLAASGQEIGQAETQAPSTTSHQTDNGVK